MVRDRREISGTLPVHIGHASLQHCDLRIQLAQLMNFRRQPCNLRILRLRLPLLLFDRFDQERGEAGVVHAGGVLAVLLPLHDLRDHGAHFFSDDADLMLAVGLQIVSNAAQFLDLVERAMQRLDVGFPATPC